MKIAATVTTPFVCGDSHEIVDSGLMRNPRQWGCGTPVFVVEDLGSKLRIELPNGMFARVGRERIALTPTI